MAKLPLPIRALFFPSRPPQSVAERHLRKFWEQELSGHPLASLIWQSRQKWAAAGRPLRYAVAGAITLVILGALALVFVVPGLRHSPFGAGLSTATTTPATGNSQTGVSSPQNQSTTASQTTNLQTLLLCGGAVVVGIGVLALAASLDERQRRRRPQNRP